MPIQLDNIDQQLENLDPLSKIGPSFFHSEVTGNGRHNRGLLNPGFGPMSAHDADEALTNRQAYRRVMLSHGGISRRVLPIFPRIPEDYTTSHTYRTDQLFFVDQNQASLSRYTTFFNIQPQTLVITKDENPNATEKRKNTIVYRFELIYILSSQLAQGMPDEIVASRSNKILFTENPLLTGLKELKPLQRTNAEDDFRTWLNDYKLYDRMEQCAKDWAGDGIARHTCEIIDVGSISNNLEPIARQLRYLENYQVSLDAYQSIFDHLEQTFNNDILKMLVRQNLNLLMNQTLSEIKSVKHLFPVPPTSALGINQPKPAVPAIHPHLASLGLAMPMAVPQTPTLTYSTQQKRAIESVDTCTLVRSGAGSGKSSVILARVDNLINNGVHPQDITVTSFTNAAADNIKAKNPLVNTGTIAKLIHDIYRNNYPTHELSSLDTVMNSLNIYLPNNSDAHEFRRILMNVARNEPQAFSALNIYIEDNFDLVLNMLNTIRQTTLELEITICYQSIDQLQESGTPPKFLILDEVQDTSIFEFIFMLRYAIKHKANVFMVGDAAQVLYEFRAANPKALNTLEKSGVFATFELTTNYRSNQEILDFANVILKNIEANQFAQIQLQANNLHPVTPQSFTEKVKLVKREFARMTEVTGALPDILMSKEVRSYIDECLKKNETVAFLSHTRRNVYTAEDTLRTMYPNAVIHNLTPKLNIDNTMFTKFITNYWDEIKLVNPQNAAFTIHREMIKHCAQLEKGDPAKVQKIITERSLKWYTTTAPKLGSWLSQNAAGKMTNDEFFDTVRESLISFEIAENSVRRSILGQQNDKAKKARMEEHPDIVVSTIHSVKGLEFDHVIVLYQDTMQMDEADKRMFYVAFTRAMKSEMIIAYAKTSKNKMVIEWDYESIIDRLTEQQAALAQAGLVDPVDDEPDDIV